MKKLTRHDFEKIEGQRRKPLPVDLPPSELLPDGGTVFVRAWTQGEKDAHQKFLIDGLRLKDAVGKRKTSCLKSPKQGSMIVLLSACDDSGARLFAEEDLDFLDTLDALVLEPIIEAAEKHNGLTAKTQETQEEEAKNDSGTTPTSGSPTDSERNLASSDPSASTTS